MTIVRLTGTETYSSAHLFLTSSVYFSSCCLLKAWNHHVRMFESKCKHSNWKKTIGFVDFLWNSDYSATYWWTQLWSWRLISRSPHTNNQYESLVFATNFCLLTLLVNTGKIKVLNWDQNTSKNANITLYTKKIKTLCNTLNWENRNSEFVILVVRWAERDKSF